MDRINKLEVDLENQRKTFDEKFDLLEAAIQDVSMKYDEIIKVNDFLIPPTNSSRRREAQ